MYQLTKQNDQVKEKQALEDLILKVFWITSVKYKLSNISDVLFVNADVTNAYNWQLYTNTL